MDPLYHQTSAQFDEGGAKGLLLNNLGVYGGCRVLFDSSEVPAKCMESVRTATSLDVIDLSFAKGLMMKQLCSYFHAFNIYFHAILKAYSPFLIQNALKKWSCAFKQQMKYHQPFRI